MATVRFEDLPETITRWEKNFRKNSLAARKKSASVFIDEVANNTPQNTGQTVSNWKAAVNVVPQGLTPTFGKGARNLNIVAVKTINKEVIRGLRANQDLYIANTNPEVMQLLERGFSRQAPSGNIIAKAVAKALREYDKVDNWLADDDNAFIGF